MVNSFYVLFPELGMAQRKFAQCLGEFQFEYIGDAKTDDERCIGKRGLCGVLSAEAPSSVSPQSANACLLWFFTSSLNGITPVRPDSKAA